MACRSPLVAGMRRFIPLALFGLLGCTPTEPSSPLPIGAEPFEPSPAFAEWFQRTEACSGLTGSLDRVEWYLVPGVDAFTTDQGEKVGMWSRSGRSEIIVLAGNFVQHEMVVRHEMLHSLIGHAGHPTGLFAERCQLTWETWPSL